MKWIGLTGGLGSGKSTVSQMLRERGWPVVDADQIARDVVVPGTPGLQSVVDLFGANILQPNGELDRAELAKRVFADPIQLEKLEQLLHPLIQNEVKKRRQGLSADFAFYDVPLLFEKQLQSQFDWIVVVGCGLDQQKERIKKRTGWKDEEVERRLAVQLPLAEKMKEADFVVHNEKDMIHLTAEVEKLIAWLKAKVKT